MKKVKGKPNDMKSWRRHFQWKYLAIVLIGLLFYTSYESQRNIERLSDELTKERKYVKNLLHGQNPKILPKQTPHENIEHPPPTPSEKASEEKPTLKTSYEFGTVTKIAQSAYDHTRGTPTDPEMITRRDFVRNMMKHAWNGYKARAWGYNEVKPNSGKPSTSNIFGRAKTGATIIDGLDTLWIMGLEEEFEEGKQWVKNTFNLKISNQLLSTFETVIRFLGGLLGAYHMSGDEMFAEKALEVATSMEPAFASSPWPSAHFNPATKNTDASAGRVLAEVGSFHLEYYDLAYAVGDKHWWDRAYGIRKLLKQVKSKDGLIANRLGAPRMISSQWSVSPQGNSYSYGAEGDSYYEYLIKSYVQTGEKDQDAKDMYFASLAGAKKWLLKETPDGHQYFQDYPGGKNSMQHLACFSGGMLAYGAKYGETYVDDLEIGASVTTSCHLSYHNSPSHIGTERFSMLQGVGPGSPGYYILRPEVVESYFYLWRLTKEERFRDMAWEAAQAIEKYCRAEFGYAGLGNAASKSPKQDDLQRSFFLAETLKYLYLIFSEDDLISMDEFVFNTEAHPLIITK